MKKILLFLLLLLAGTLFFFLNDKSDKKEPPKVITINIPKPDSSLTQFDLSDLTDQPININKYLGKPLVLNFWATWCLPCVAEMGSFETVRQEKQDSVHFILISDEPFEKIKQFQIKKGYGLTYLKSNTAFSEYGINKIPQTYFYNKYGQLTHKYDESIYSKIIREELENMN